MAAQKDSSSWWIGFLVILFVLADFAAAQPEPFLVAWWKFDEGEGDIAEDSAGTSHAMVEGPVWTTGVINGALAFSGGCVRPGYSPVLDDLALHEFTIAMWISTSNAGQSVLIGNYMDPVSPSWNFEIFAGGVLRLYLDGEDHIGGSSVADGNWHHVAALGHVGQQIKLYIDGQESYSGVSAKGPYMVTNPTLIGMDNRMELPLFFGGVMDDVRIYDIALSPDQIKRLAGFATWPSPTDGAGMISVDAQLSWTTGVGALSHDVYFGTDNPPTTLIADDILDTSCVPGTLDCATLYYWRVDENTAAGTITGDVWSFTTHSGYSLTVNVEPVAGGSVTLAPPGGLYPPGTEVTLTAEPAQGWAFDCWSGDLTGSANPETIVMDASKNVTAHFGYALTVNLEPMAGGSVTLEPGGGIYPPDTEVTLTAESEPGWVFVCWSGDLTGSTNPDSIVMDANKTVTAHFGYALTVNLEPMAGGLVTLEPSGGIYPPETEVTLTAESAPGWAFGGWSGDLAGDTNPTTIIMDSAKIVDAHFEFTGGIIYVNDDANGLNNGTSWANALTDLQDALAGATPGKQIWVAAGTYKPGTQLTDSFQMKNGVAIYGGFVGQEDPNNFDLARRDFDANQTILSGDIGTPDVDTDNCYHVFYHPNGLDLDSSAVLDGFIISAGYAGDSGEHQHGGGMFNYNCSPTINNCTFTGNATGPGADGADGAYGNPGSPGGNSGHGGAMYNYGSSPVLASCTFIGNSTGNGGSGGNGGDGFGGTPTNGSPGGNSGYGGAMYNYGSSPTLTNCTFIGNSTGDGGRGGNGGDGTFHYYGGDGGNGGASGSGAGIYNYNSSPSLMNCAFISNSTGTGGVGGSGGYSSQDFGGFGGGGGDAGSGAGIYNAANSSPTLTNCTFWNNLTGAGGRGGDGGDSVWYGGYGGKGGYGGAGAGMYNDSSSPALTNCTFLENSTGPGGQGGNGGDVSASFETGGSGGNGGAGGGGAGTYNYTSEPALMNCIFQSNSTGAGGAGGNGGDGDTHGNDGTGGNGGYAGAIHNNKSSSTMTNCTLWANSTGTGASGGHGGAGGAMYNTGNPPAVVTNCTFYDNICSYSTGGAMSNSSSSPTVTNCILWGDTPGEIYNSASSPVVTYCDVEGGYGASDTNNIDADPLFADPLNGDLHLLSDSPCIDAGSNSAPNLPPADFEGHRRIFNGIADMGADEFALIIYVNASAVGNNDGIKWEDAFTDLQDALNAAIEGYEIWVAAGNYKPTSGVDRSAFFELKDGISVYGGFPNEGNPLWDERHWQTNPTILSGDIGTEGITTDNCYHVLYNAVETASSQILAANESGGSGRSALLEGFVITGGNADGASENSRGGGVYNFFFDLTMMNCRLENNSAVSGGGIANLSCFPTLINCLITANTAQDGGGMYNLMAFPNVINCTFSRNTASNGSGMFNGILSEPYVTNCILWGDTGGEIYNDAESFAEVNFSDVEGGYGGPDANNIDADPLFADPAGGHLRLSADSPCIDRGDSNAVPPEVTTDLDGNPRILDGDCSGIAAVDMGAYEFSFAYIGDFDDDCDVDFFDYAVLALSWLLHDSQTGYDTICDISLPPDKFIDWNDLKIFTDNWLAGTEP